jgi:phosphatidylglycerol:prolipoprotein diacylglycerol transferase
VGVAVVLLFFCWKKKLSLLRIADTIVIPAALGLALGRFGNFINQELYGTVTTLPWGIAVPGVEGLRHPAQLYSMCLDLCNAALCYMHLRWVRVRKPGQTTALFLVLYGIARFAVEFVREQQYPLVDLFGFSLTRGQLLTIPVFLFGILLWMFVVMPEEE